VQLVGPESAATVRAVMRAAFEEYRGVLEPPSSSNIRLYERLGYEVTSVQPHPKQPASMVTQMRKFLD
jgi:hypothetical protein